MRYAILSDIHGNLEAFQAVLDALSKERIDRYLSLGDVVGYGADPHACVKLLKALNPEALIAGNHEWAVLDLLDIGYFNEATKEAVIWTKNKLSAEDAGYLKYFSLVYDTEKFSLVHGTLRSPERFYYIFSDVDAHKNMPLMKAPLLFVGHSHVAGIFYSHGAATKYTAGPKIGIDRSEKYVVNAGSIGQPRDLDPRASCAIYDDEEDTVEIKRVKYDIKTAQEKILKEGLPGMFASRLSEGR